MPTNAKSKALASRLSDAGRGMVIEWYASVTACSDRTASTFDEADFVSRSSGEVIVTVDGHSTVSGDSEHLSVPAKFFN